MPTIGKAYAHSPTICIFVYRTHHRHGSTSNCVRVERTGLTRGVSWYAMTQHTKYAIGLCVFLTIAPMLGGFIDNSKTISEVASNYFPYIHLSVSNSGGLPFGESIGVLFGMLIMLIGIIGLITFNLSKSRFTGALQLLLFITVFYCGLRTLLSVGIHLATSGFSDYDWTAKIFVVTGILSEIGWIILCVMASNELQRRKINTPANNG